MNLAALVDELAFISGRCKDPLFVAEVVQFNNDRPVVVCLRWTEGSMRPVNLNESSFGFQPQRVWEPGFKKLDRIFPLGTFFKSHNSYVFSAAPVFTVLDSVS